MTPISILIVEDEYIIAQDIAERITQLGYRAAGRAARFEDAVALAKSAMPDLILMDIMLDGTRDGIDTARAIREEHDIPVIFITAYADDAMIKRATAVAPYGYLIKPFNDRELAAAIETALYRASIERALKSSEARFKALFEHSPVAAWETDFSAVASFFQTIRDKGVEDIPGYFTEHPEELLHTIGLIRAVHVNRESTRVFGTTDDSAPPSLVRILCEESYPVMRTMLAVLADGKTDYSDELAVLFPDGTRHVISFTLVVMPGEKPLTSAVLSFSDITERRQAQSYMKEYRRQERVLTDVTHALAKCTTADDIYNYVATVLKREAGADFITVSGYNRHTGTSSVRVLQGFGDLITKIIETVHIDPNDIGISEKEMGDLAPLYKSGRLERIPGGLQDLVAGHLPAQLMAVVERMMGVRSVYCVGFTWDNKLYGGVTFLYKTDTAPRNEELIALITAAAGTALRRKYAEDALRDSEEMMRATIEQSADGILIADAEGRIIEWNKGLETIIGYTRDDIIGTYMWDFQYRIMAVKDGTLRDELKTAFRKSPDISSRTWMNRPIGYDIQTKAGEFKTIELIAYPISLGRGMFYGIDIRDTTAQKKTELETENRRRFLESLIEVIPTPIFYKALDGTYIGCNSAFADLIGAARADIQGKTVFETDTVYAPKHHENDVRVYKDGVSVTYECQMNTPQGLRECVFYKAPFTGADGKITGLVGAVIDMTERNRREHALEEQRRLLQVLSVYQKNLFLLNTEETIRETIHVLMSFAPVVSFFVINAAQKTVLCAWDSDKGYHREDTTLENLAGSFVCDVIEQKVPLFIKNTETAVFRNTLEKSTIEASRLKSMLYYPILVDNTCLGLLTVGGRDEDDIGDNAWRYLSIIAPVVGLALTKSRLFEQAQQNEAWYRTLIETAPEAVIIYNIRTCEIIDCNEPGIRLFRYNSKDAVLGVNNENTSDKYLARFLNEHYTDFVTADSVLNAVIYTAADTAVPCEVRIARLPPAEQGIVRISIVDVSERVRIEEERQKHTRALLQNDKLKALGELAAGMAHEIAQPLTGIGLAAESTLSRLHDAGAAGDYARKKINDIADYVERIKRIIDHVRTFSRERTLELKSGCDARESIQNALSLVGTQYRNHSIIIETAISAAPLIINGNIYELEQVILNLLANAKYAVEARAGKNTAGYGKKIHISAIRNDNNVIIEIRDNGIGIPAENIEKIFTPFFTTKPINEGTGLGLSVSLGILQAMKGTITVESVPDEFTLARISLPAT
ncbi:MAG: PAS domain S-box protein [Spirochaetes bacterium]|nr:PAS domain S-box protein [Spirochaetota bacterium]